MDPSHSPKFSLENLHDNIWNNLPPTSPGTGIIRIDSYPPNTEVYLDGDFLGVTPLSITDVEIGPHQFLIKGMGLQDYNGHIFVNDGSFNPVNAYLQPQIQQIPTMTSPYPYQYPYPYPPYDNNISQMHISQMQTMPQVSSQIQALQTNNQVTVPTNFLLGIGVLIVGGLLALAYILRDR